MDLFTEAFNHAVKVEGGFTNDPNDKGNFTPDDELKGTKYGISANAYPEVDIAGLTLQKAQAIYRRDYWDANNLDKYPAELAFLMFDMCINHGARNAKKILQRALCVAEDGIVGRRTMYALSQVGSDFYKDVHIERVDFYKDIKSFNHYGKGWLSRAYATYSHIKLNF